MAVACLCVPETSFGTQMQIPVRAATVLVVAARVLVRPVAFLVRMLMSLSSEPVLVSTLRKFVGATRMPRRLLIHLVYVSRNLLQCPLRRVVYRPCQL